MEPEMCGIFQVVMLSIHTMDPTLLILGFGLVHSQ